MPYKDKDVERTNRHNYYLQHKEQIKQRAKEWAEANPERHKEIKRNSAKRNYQAGSEEEKLAASLKVLAWQKANPEKVNAKNSAWRKANPEKSKTSRKRWNNFNKDKVHELKQIRRAREMGAFVEKVSRMVVYNRNKGICGICGEFVKRHVFHVDHIIPLSKGGLHCYENVQPAHPSCNHKKSNKIDYSPSASVKSK